MMKWSLPLFFLLSLLFATPVFAGDAEDVLGLVNAERAANGLPPLALNCYLNSAAQRHSNSMSVNGFFDHNDPYDGSTAGSRIVAAGYSPYSAIGENIASGQTSASQVVSSWMGSAAHRANILGSYTHMGLARVGNIWTQTFGNGGPDCGAGSASTPIIYAPEAGERLNSGYPASPVGLYCGSQSGYVEIWRAGESGQGVEIFNNNIANAVQSAVTTGQDQLIFQGGDVSLYALASDYIAFNALDPVKPYTLTFPSTVCGLLTVTQPVTPSTTTASVPVTGNTYTVQAGDTLSLIAQRHGVSLQNLVTANNLSSVNQIYVGQVLNIPAGGTAIVTTTTPSTSTPTLTGDTYTVQAGDNLFRIALRFGVPLATLAEVNHIENPRLIYVGQVLTIP